jgi:endo-1,4-beta-xylanase
MNICVITKASWPLACLRGFFACLTIAFAAGTTQAEDTQTAAAPVARDGQNSSDVIVVDLWPQSPPVWTPPSGEEHDTSGADGRNVAGRSVVRLGNVSKPQLHVYPAAADAEHAKTMIVICPGGGYSILAWDLEGTEIAEQFNALGFSAAVLKYRVPTRSMDQPWRPPVQDVQRALSLIRSGDVKETKELSRVGLVGFSAGGNAAARAATAGGRRFYDRVDQADEASCQPDFVGLIYPWLMVPAKDEKKSAQNDLGILPELTVDASTAPMFFAHANDDPISCRNSVEMFSLLQQHGVPAELHIYTGGGHGFGARDKSVAAANWPEQMAKWLMAIASKSM